ncbi:hypothetical protein BaRGS_00010798, partial [Batillaria attramentaria]
SAIILLAAIIFSTLSSDATRVATHRKLEMWLKMIKGHPGGVFRQATMEMQGEMV